MKFIPQYDETDCSAACLAMIALHYKHSLGITTIRQMAGTDRQGTNLSGLLKAAAAIGFEAKAMKGSPETLQPNLPLPFIAHVQRTSEQNVLLHFVVVEKIGKNQLVILDPAEEKKKITKKEFLDIWTGYVVFLSPNQDFQPAVKTSGFLARFFPLLKPHIGSLIRVVVATLLIHFVWHPFVFVFSLPDRRSAFFTG